MKRAAFAALSLGFTCVALACGSEGSEFPEPGSSGASGTSNGGASGGASGASGSTIGSSSSSGAPFDPEKCASDTLVGNLLPVELSVVFDNSSSMCRLPPPSYDLVPCNDPRGRWPATSGALAAFLSSPDSAGLTVSVRTYGPVGNATTPAVATNWCESNRYETPTAGFEPQPLPSEDLANRVRALESTIDVQNPNATQTQTGAAITGSAVYSRAREAALGGEKRVAILLITDGNPAGCGTDPTNESDADRLQAIDAARSAFEQGTEVYVLNIGGTEAVLNQIAAAGGTSAAITIDGTDGAAIRGALDTIRGKALSCEIEMPVPAQGTADPTKLNVGWTPNTGDATQYLPQSADCADPRGWQYDDPANPKHIRLCGAICDEVLGTQTGKIDVVLGCETYVSPVN